ncbi:uncharacterized protein LOC132334606 [Haemorhous mexicanus]|uniref:uncharacterized protein LOC132334606 n=1 Tax=Haemorhous mexicanus TaxID=30427 RepID=UPI0028BD4644|nr:uncharacterized protein LOC132334606 [Haemorhous mexicanus]
MQPRSGHKSRKPPLAAFAEQRRYLWPSLPGLGLLSLLSQAPGLECSMDAPSLPALLLQTLCDSIMCLWQEETAGVGTGLLADLLFLNAETGAAMLDLLVEEGVSDPTQVPAMVRYIHQWLTANESAGHRLDEALLELTEEYPSDVMITLLRWAPSCDRAAATMWGTIMSSSRTAEPALLLLLDALSAWPVYSVYTSDGDNAGVFALAATVALWRVFNLTWRSPVMLEYFPNLFLRLLFQAYISTQEMPEEVETFWKGCQEEHGLAANPNRCSMPVLAVSPSLPCPQGRSQGSRP